jgi:hypothetical protein
MCTLGSTGFGRLYYGAPMATAHVRVVNAISGNELQPKVTVPCMNLTTHVRSLLGSRPSRPITLFHNGMLVEDMPDIQAAPDDYFEFTASFGSPMSSEERVRCLQELKDANNLSDGDSDDENHVRAVFANLSDVARDDTELVLLAVQRDGLCLGNASVLCSQTKDIVMAAVQQYGGALCAAGEALRDNGDIVLAAVRKNGWALQFAGETCRNNEDIVLAAVRQDVSAWQYAGEGCRNAKHVLLAALKQQNLVSSRFPSVYTNSNWCPSFLLQFAGNTIRHDKDIVLAFVRWQGYALQHAGEACRDDKDIVLAAVRQNGYALQFATETCRDDKNIVLAAVCRDGLALQHAGEACRDDKHIVLAAVRRNGIALQHAGEACRDDKDITRVAVRADASAFQYAGEACRSDKDIIMLTVRSPIILCRRHRCSEWISHFLFRRRPMLKLASTQIAQFLF